MIHAFHMCSDLCSTFVVRSPDTDVFILLLKFGRETTPDGHGWYQENGKLAYQWTDGDLMPKELVNVLIEELPDNEENEEDPEIVSYTDEIYDSEN